MTTTPAHDFAAWLGDQLHPETATAEAEQPPSPATPKPDLSQGGTGTTIPPDAGTAFAHLLHDHL